MFLIIYTPQNIVKLDQCHKISIRVKYWWYLWQSFCNLLNVNVQSDITGKINSACNQPHQMGSFNRVLVLYYVWYKFRTMNKTYRLSHVSCRGKHWFASCLHLRIGYWKFKLLITHCRLCLCNISAPMAHCQSAHFVCGRLWVRIRGRVIPITLKVVHTWYCFLAKCFGGGGKFYQSTTLCFASVNRRHVSSLTFIIDSYKI